MPAPELVPVMQEDRRNLSHHEQMLDAQAQCVPCKLCGGKAEITDAGPGHGYYITCEHGSTFKASDGCLIPHRRLGGWAYNVMEWWNRLHRLAAGAKADELAACLEPGEAFEMGFAWRGMLAGQTLEDSRAVGRTLYANAFEKIAPQIEREVQAQGFNSFQDADAGISAAWKIILAALSQPTTERAETGDHLGIAAGEG